MAKIGDTMPCLECGGEMRYEVRDDPVEYKGHVRTHRTKGWWCTNCDEAIFEGKQLLSRERALVELRAEVDRVLLPEQVAAIREKLGISQREAGRVLGGGPRAFQKYESGQTPVSEPMQNLLLLLDGNPERLKELRKRQQLASGKRVDSLSGAASSSRPSAAPPSPAR